MRRLLLLRHAKTETDAPSGRDFDRRLDARGLSDAEEIGQWLAQRTPSPTLVLVSPAVRARQTWDIVARHLRAAPEMIEVGSLYNATPSALMRAIQDHAGDASSLMVVAHNPGLHELAIAMTMSGDAAARRMLDDNLPTGAVVTLDFDVPIWADVGFRRGHLVSVVSPKSLRSAAHEDQ